MSEQEPPQKENSRKKIEPTIIVALITALGAVIVGIVTRQSPSPPSIQSSSPSGLVSADEQNYDLTGVWESKDVGGTGHAKFYVRLDKDKSTVWWYAQGKGWDHVLKGTLSGNQILGDWADIPIGNKSAQNRGEMKITIISPTKMSANDSKKTYVLNRSE